MQPVPSHPPPQFSAIYAPLKCNPFAKDRVSAEAHPLASGARDYHCGDFSPGPLSSAVMKRVLLVSPNTVKVPYPVPPIGLGMLATALESAYEVRLFDGCFSGTAGLFDLMADFKPDFIGIGIRNVDDTDFQGGVSFLDEIRDQFVIPIKQVAKGTPIILGGAGYSIFPKELLEFFGADWGIEGEGEGPFRQLLDALSADEIPGVIPGLVGWRDGHPFSNPRVILSGLLHTPESNLFRHLDFSPYRRAGSYPIQARRGCNRHCVYCTYPAIEGRVHRLRPPHEIVDEIETVQRQLPEVTFEFVDSTFNDPPGHAEAICREIIARGIRVRLRTMGMNPGGVTDELVALMVNAGFRQIDSTPDSAAPAVIKGLGKNFGIADLIRAASVIRRHQIPTMWFFIFAGPGETPKTVQQTFDFIDKYIDPDDLVSMSVGLRIHPRTRLMARAVSDGLVKRGDDITRPVWYLSPGIHKADLDIMLTDFSKTRPNCLPPGESTPSAEMRAQAMKIRAEQGLDEPMFRTLLRIRRGWAKFN